MMRTAHKRSFYLDPAIEEVLLSAAPKKLSARANELMRKGLLKEKEEAMALEYSRCAEAAEKQSQEDPDELASSVFAYRLFEDDS